jgi:hypothetical protein
VNILDAVLWILHWNFDLFEFFEKKIQIALIFDSNSIFKILNLGDKIFINPTVSKI